jgi:hypothetical protein
MVQFAYYLHAFSEAMYPSNKIRYQRITLIPPDPATLISGFSTLLPICHLNVPTSQCFEALQPRTLEKASTDVTLEGRDSVQIRANSTTKFSQRELQFHQCVFPSQSRQWIVHFASRQQRRYVSMSLANGRSLSADMTSSARKRVGDLLVRKNRRSKPSLGGRKYYMPTHLNRIQSFEKLRNLFSFLFHSVEVGDHY